MVAQPQAAPRTVPYEVFQHERDLRLKAEQERDRWKHEFYLLRDVRRAPVLKPVDKEVLQEFRHIQQWGKVDGLDDSKRANFKTIAKTINVSPDTVMRSSERLEKLGLAKILEYEGPQDEHERKYIKVYEDKVQIIKQLEDPEHVVPKQGGDRYQCQHCQSHNIALRTVRHLKCLDCQHETILDDTGWKKQNGHNAQKQLASEELATQQASQKQNADHCVYTQSIEEVGQAQKQVASTASASYARSLPPEFLRQGRIWCCGRLEWNEKRQKYDKVPYVADMQGTTKARSNDPSTCRTYDYARAVFEKSQSWTQKNSPPFDFLMFMCDGTFTFLDQDHCIDKETGEVDQAALDRARKLDSYTEFSWSGDGLHTYAIGTLPPGRRRIQDIEMYDQCRPCVYTGKLVPGFPHTMEQRKEEIASLHAEIFPPQPEYLWHLQPENEEATPGDEELTQLRQDILAKASKAKNGAKLMKLWNGDFSDFPSQSEADLALCKMLRFYGEVRSVSTLDWLFRCSKLYRPKWERADYRNKTLMLALGLQERKAS